MRVYIRKPRRTIWDKRNSSILMYWIMKTYYDVPRDVINIIMKKSKLLPSFRKLNN